MEAMKLDAHQGRSLDVDVCTQCQLFWFDKWESLQLAPASTLRLMKLIGEQPPKSLAFSGEARCPRCSSKLKSTVDLQRSTRFSYWRCPNDHGRLIRFFEFLREKNFIKQLSAKEIDELRKHIRVVNCSNCGAPIDLGAGSGCAHCKSPISMLDMNQPQQLLAQLQEAAKPKTIDPKMLGIDLAIAKHDMELLFHEPEWKRDATTAGLVQACLGSVARWLSRP
jgi:hypothetical protein